ncbi:hypothetical protein DMC01_06675 [Campylobacter troglodytis]|nr:hypothetical protein DMC01_06675 [Campylobacter troglodytis]
MTNQHFKKSLILNKNLTLFKTVLISHINLSFYHRKLALRAFDLAKSLTYHNKYYKNLKYLTRTQCNKKRGGFVNFISFVIKK